MAGADSMFLFQRGAVNEDDYDSDVWDDTALIEAYDAAVAPLKAKLAEHTGDASILNGGGKTTGTSQSKKKKNKKKKARQAKKKQQANGWTVGDFCQAVFTEDGTVYRAKILSINPDDNTCVVRYLGYGNEEEQSLDDLIPNDSSSRKQRRSDSVSFSETDSVDSRQSSASHRETKKSRQSGTPWGWPAFSDFHQGNAHAPPPPPPPPPLFPWMSHQSPFSMPQPPMGSAASMPFSMMPPPPPPMPGDNVSDENEALCSMLLSWYMSGYHTGYYQGLRQGRQHDFSTAMGPSR
ncbi:survival motor neuron protein 1-like [Littorina saxatilis]|uniref:Tudor domain-containing protein n=1 Tax=Littorina saxatilis TaxID=31220 RepID=A0AAN9C250_9CAEN